MYRHGVRIWHPEDVLAEATRLGVLGSFGGTEPGIPHYRLGDTHIYTTEGAVLWLKGYAAALAVALSNRL